MYCFLIWRLYISTIIVLPIVDGKDPSSQFDATCSRPQVGTIPKLTCDVSLDVYMFGLVLSNHIKPGYWREQAYTGHTLYRYQTCSEPAALDPRLGSIFSDFHILITSLTLQYHCLYNDWLAKVLDMDGNHIWENQKHGKHPSRIHWFDMYIYILCCCSLQASTRPKRVQQLEQVDQSCNTHTHTHTHTLLQVLTAYFDSAF